MNRLGFIFSSLLVVLALASSMLFVVDQRQFGVVYALGQIVSKRFLHRQTLVDFGDQ